MGINSGFKGLNLRVVQNAGNVLTNQATISVQRWTLLYGVR